MGMVDVEVLTLQVEAALPAVVEPDEEDPDVVRRAFGDQEGIARQVAGLVNQGRGGRPVGIVEHGVVQRGQNALKRGRLAHVTQNTLVMRVESSRKSNLASPQGAYQRPPRGPCRGLDRGGGATRGSPRGSRNAGRSRPAERALQP